MKPRALKTECKRGHPFDEANTIHSKKGRNCRRCLEMHWKEAHKRDAARRAAARELRGGLYGSPEYRFARSIEPDPNSGCHLWTGSAELLGYGRIWDGEMMWYAHRFAWVQRHGPIPDGLFVCHRCDTPACVNVDHLFLGTAMDNIQDRTKKGRSARGSGNTKAKLTEADVIEIKRGSLRDVPVRDIAAMFGVRKWTIQKIINGQRWAHV
jgi:hypothetical protein